MTPLFSEMERISQRFTTAIRGITVVKTVWANDEGLSVVRFEISSARDDSVRLRLSEPVPDDFPMENIGPHPKYGGDKWTKTADRELVYTERLEPNGETFTLYGIKELSADTLEAFLTDAVVTIDLLGDEPATDSDDSMTMTTEDTETDELDTDDTDLEDDFTRGGAPSDDFTRGGGSSFDSQIPRVEDLGSLPGGWNTDQSTQHDDPTNIQFVGSKAHASESDETDESHSPIELEDPTQEADDESETAVDDGEESDAVDSTEPQADPENPETPSDDTLFDEEPHDEEGDEVESTSEEESSTGTDEDHERDQERSTDEDSQLDAAELDTESDDDSLVDALVTELSTRDLSEDERTVIREALGVSAPTSVDVRLRHVQNRVDDLAAYTTALESFLDENGTAEQVLDDLQTETESMRDDIERLESALTASKEAIKIVEQQVTELEDRMVDEATFEERLDELDGQFVSESELDAQLTDLSDDLAEIRGDVETGKTWRSNLSQAIQLPGMMDGEPVESEADE
ncbi:hypothetical protein [Haloferax sp. DFSO52]|uniref:hypothetical protein n=1 Tax=Haloferax sp. DFSO52 TaxID=3388505 RepID=UPI003A86F1A2